VLATGEVVYGTPEQEQNGLGDVVSVITKIPAERHGCGNCSQRECVSHFPSEVRGICHYEVRCVN